MRPQRQRAPDAAATAGDNNNFSRDFHD